jgi:signal transduction histidine kinase
LGLSICRHLIGAHGGTFDLTSAAGKGTTIRIVFPAAQESGA